ncbi:Mobile element protein [Candidatus Enterovibrio escicola]|uniref:Mobile element protein n=1 Tax=Candidatus Enterovibrio escicola TaxID=1927127 RepID=A0A2A5T551_9GAMM|nr:Mobile element protein [Candidatus Enterovibrio escacola]
MPSLGAVIYVIIYATGLKVYDEGEWKMRKHGKWKQRIWLKLNLDIDVSTA